MSERKREVWIVEWDDPDGNRYTVGYSWQTEEGARRHVAASIEEDKIRETNGRKPAWKGCAWTVSRYVPAAEQACAVPAEAGQSEAWVSVEWLGPSGPRRPECADPNCGLSTDTAEAFRVIRDCEPHDYCHVECAMSHERELGRQEGIAEAQTEWASVGERLPEPGIVVLTWDGDVMMLSEWDRSIWADIRPTHWMPLPPPPKSSEGGE